MSSKAKYEVVEIDGVDVTVDVSMFVRDESLWFNATQIANSFDKRVKEFLKLESTKEYIGVILKGEDSSLLKFEDLVIVRRGRMGGTWLHRELAFEFFGWCSAIFRRSMHKWVEKKLKEEQSRKRARIEAKTGFFPLTDREMNFSLIRSQKSNTVRG